MNQPTNPERAQDKQDAAEVKNFTRSPNMLIFGYRELSPQEKWLYVCLKHLCGKRGTRHLALRYISEQTGISVGALSTSKDKKGNVNEGMIRHLHNAGLIHSEIKKKDGKGNAQYHITITDVWDLNQTFFIERAKSRSEFGQDTGQEEDESTEPVRISDEPVQSSDRLVQNPNASVRISDEPVRIPGQYQDYSKTTNKTDNKTTEQESVPASESQLDDSGSVEPARTHSSQFAFQVQGFAHFYHDYCIHAQDRGINDGITLVVKNLADVPPDAECQICYKPVHGPHGYGEPSLAERANQFSGTTNYPGKVWPDGSVTSELAQQKGQPDATTQETAGPDSREKRVAPTEQPAGSVATALTATVPTGKTAATAQLSTSMTTYPQASAKVEPEKPKKPASGRTQSKKSEKPDPEFTPEGRKVYDAWCSLFKSPPRTAEKTVDCANDLYARLMPWCQDLRVSCKDLLSEIKGWLYTTDPDWYRRKGVTLCDIGSQFERWQSAKTEELERAKKPTKTTQQEQSPLELLRAQQQRYAQLPAKG